MTNTDPLPPLDATDAPAICWKRNLVFVWLSQFFSLAGFCFAMPFAAYYIQELGITDEAQKRFYTGVFQSSAGLTLMIMSPVWGAMGDRFGRRLMMLRAGCGAIVVLYMMAIVQNVEQLIALRLLQGVFTGTMPAAQTLVSATTPHKRHGTALGTLATASYGGIMAGQFIGGRCADAWGYAATFKVAAGLMVVSTLMILFGVQEDFTPPPPKQPAKTRTPVWQRPGVRSLMPVLVLTFAFASVRLMPAAVIPLFIQALNGGSLSGSATIAGDLGAVRMVASILAGYALGRLVDRVSPRTIGRISAVGGALGMLALAHVEQMLSLFEVVFLTTFAIGGLEPVLQVWLGRVSKQAERGKAFGFATSARSLGWVVGPMAGAGVAIAADLRAVFLVQAVLFVLLVPLVGWAARARGDTDPTRAGTLDDDGTAP